MFFLNGITMFGEAPTVQDMADLMGCSHQNANKLAAKLLREKYITSVQDENDRRKQKLSLTDKAKDFLNRNKTEAYKCVADIFSVVTETELESTISVMAKLTERLEVLHGGKMNKRARQYIGLLSAVLAYYIIHKGAHLIYALTTGVFMNIFQASSSTIRLRVSHREKVVFYFSLKGRRCIRVQASAFLPFW